MGRALITQALDDQQGKRAVEAIRRAMSRQTVLVNGLLDHAAILSGTLRVERKPVDVDAVVRPLGSEDRLRRGLILRQIARRFDWRLSAHRRRGGQLDGRVSEDNMEQHALQAPMPYDLPSAL